MKKLTNFSADGLNGRKETLREIRDRAGYHEDPASFDIAIGKIGRLFAWVITGAAIVCTLCLIFKNSI